MVIDGSPRPLPDYVIEHLTRAMFAGELAPGERLSPMKLAAELGVSHIPVREALSTLEASGHVMRQPRRGYFVATLSLEDVEDVYHWRRVLEDEANSLAVPLLRDEDMARMRALNTQMRAAQARADRPEFGVLNREWHFIPVTRVGSRQVERFLTHLWDAAARYQATLLQEGGFLREVQDQHEALLTCYENRDVKAVNRLLEDHRQTTLSAVRLALTESVGAESMTPGRRSVGPQGLLSGIRVVELAQVLAGPFCGQHLADAGADVIKVEPPGGDGTRQWGPPYLKECEPRPGYPGDSAYYACCNRNKRGIAVDLTTKSGREVVRRLIRDADVVIENGSPSTMASWGLTYDACRESNEGLVWASITGYGSTGPDQGLPGYDFAVQAGAGLMSITGDVDGPPMKVGVAVSDLATGATAAIGILAALTGRQRTGRGGHVEVSLLETQVSWLANVASNYLVSGKEPQRFGNGHPNVVPYQLFMARDREIALAVGNDGQFKRLCTVLGTESLVTDPRFISNQARVANREVLVAMIAEAICARPAKDWVDLMRAARVPVELVRSIGEVMNDPQVRHRGLIVDLEHPAAGPFSLLGSAISFDGVTGVTPQPPPMFSEHTVEVLTEAGFTPAEVDALIQSNAVVQAVMPTRSVQGVPS